MDVNFDELNSLIDSGELVVVDFWAQWCNPCKVMGPVYTELANDNPDVNIKKIEIDKETEAAHKFGVRNIPAFLFFKDGEVVDRLFGTHDKEVLQAKIDEHA
jgi:thioredoxin 1